MKRWMYNALIAAFALAFVVSATALGIYFWRSHQANSKYNDLANLVQQNRPTASATTPSVGTDPADPTGTVGTAPIESSQPPTEPWVNVTDPDTGKVIQALREYAPLFEINSDFVGWLSFEGTKINYPVVHHPESTDYYLRRDFYGKYANHGCFYVREECDVFEPTDNVTIYGHNMQDGSMMAALLDYRKQSFWEEHKTFTFDTLTEHHTYEIISVFKTSATLGKGFQYHQFVDAQSEKEFDKFVDTCKDLALYDTGVTAEYGDKLVTLSTCEYSQTNGRLVVVAKRIS